MVARILFPVLTCGATRSPPHPRATIKALSSPHHPPSPLRISRPPISLPGLAHWATTRVLTPLHTTSRPYNHYEKTFAVSKLHQLSGTTCPATTKQCS